MKKILVLLTIFFLLTSCKAKKEDYYNLTFEGITVAVGYDNTEVISNINSIDTFDYELNKKEEQILNHLVIYVDDLNDKSVLIDDYSLNKGIIDTCTDLNGEIVENKGNTCVLHKVVDDRNNIILLSGDILSNNIDKIDRIEVNYKWKKLSILF